MGKEAGNSLPFTFKLTPATPKVLPEYLDNISIKDNNNVFYQDYPFSTAFIDGEFWIMHKNGYSPNVLRYKGTNIENAVREPDGIMNQTHPKWGTVVNPYILGGMWYVASEKKLYAPLHCEYKSHYKDKNSADNINRHIHMASSADKGLTWKYEGPIITRDEFGHPYKECEDSGGLWNGGDGDFYFFADERGGYVYVYSSHYLWPKPESEAVRFWSHRVARCKVSDRMAPGKWKKFYNGKWNEPGLGGKASYVEAYNVIYNSSLKKYISFNYGGGISVCSDMDKQDWSPSFRIPGATWGINDIWGWTLTDEKKIALPELGKELYVYSYWHSKPGLVSKIEFSEGKTPDSSGYTGAGVGEPVFANTMNPIRPYGEPLFDSNDLIESRRVRKVNFEHPETLYSGSWKVESKRKKSKLSGKAGESVSFVFRGSGIYWRAETGKDCGKAEIFLDGVLEKTLDLYGDFTPYQFGFVKTGLDAKKEHTIKITVKGEKNPKSKGTLVKHMSFEHEAETYRASDCFSGLQGKNQWHYQWMKGKAGGDLEFNVLRNVYTNYTVLELDPKKIPALKHGGLVSVGSDFQLPDGEFDAVRRWTAPHAGTVRIEGVLYLTFAETAGAVDTKLLHNNKEVRAFRLAKENNSKAHDLKITVKKNDTLSFCVCRNKNLLVSNCVNWDPSITYE